MRGASGGGAEGQGSGGAGGAKFFALTLPVYDRPFTDCFPHYQATLSQLRKWLVFYSNGS